jgi:mannose-6-phosphate isomerase
MPFGALVEAHPEEIAGDVPFLPPDGRFPLLVKYLFAGGYTSVQVHPCDEMARDFGEAHPGKSEAWVVVWADPESRILLGFSRTPGGRELTSLFESGDILEYVNRIPPAIGDCYPVAPGTVHAIGGGLTVFEVQTNSQVTYRLYDWGRARREGLHLARGIACLDLHVNDDPVAKPRDIPVSWGRKALLFSGEAFAIERHTTDASAPVDGDGRFVVISSIGEGGGVAFPGGTWPAAPRRTWFVPAAARDVLLLPGGDYLVCFVPRGPR